MSVSVSVAGEAPAEPSSSKASEAWLGRSLALPNSAWQGFPRSRPALAGFVGFDVARSMWGSRGNSTSRRPERADTVQLSTVSPAIQLQALVVKLSARAAITMGLASKPVVLSRAGCRCSRSGNLVRGGILAVGRGTRADTRTPSFHGSSPFLGEGELWDRFPRSLTAICRRPQDPIASTRNVQGSAAPPSLPNHPAMAQLPAACTKLNLHSSRIVLDPSWLHDPLNLRSACRCSRAALTSRLTLARTTVSEPARCLYEARPCPHGLVLARHGRSRQLALGAKQRRRCRWGPLGSGEHRGQVEGRDNPEERGSRR